MTDDMRAAAAAPDSLRADLEAAWDQLAAERGETAPAAAGEGAGPDEAADDAARGEDSRPGGRARPDEDGLAAPDDWPDDWRQRFAALPEEARPWALDLHARFAADHADRSQALAEREEELAGLQEVDAALAPWRGAMRTHGLGDGEAVSRLLEAHAALERDPAAALAMLAEAYGVDPARTGPPAPAAAGVGAADAAAPDRADGAREAQLLESLERYAAEQHDLRLLAAMQAELDARARAADADGKPLYPHFDAVRPQLAALVRAGAAGSFEDAYEQAVWADPQLRQRALEAHDAEQARLRESARREQVQKARNAGRAAPGGSEPARTVPAPARSHREELERVWDRMVDA